MSRTRIRLQCDVPVKDILCQAIRAYARAAYPEGGSDCAQVARYTLLELARQIDTGISPDNGCMEISRRPRAMVRAAIDYHFDCQDAASGSGSAHQRELLYALLWGEAVRVDDLAAARDADRAA